MSGRLPIAFSSVLPLVMMVALAIAPLPVLALGLGQIQVKSQPGQPLVAEIPIISSDPSELQGLQVRLASPETFRRIGLDPPQGLVSTLHFEPALDAGGRPVVRVTSAIPVQQPLLTFLVEVDWGQGRLVREYSALLDAPRTVSAPLQPAIQPATAAASNTIVRDPAPGLGSVEPVPRPQPDVPAPEAAPLPVPTPEPRPDAAAAIPPAAVPTPAVAAPAPGEYGPVRAGETLGRIAAGLEGTRDFSAAQTMLALLRANPDAFIGGNVNRLKRGAVLRIPEAAEVAQLDRMQAAAIVHEQIVQWRDARRPAPQPAVATVPSGADAQARTSRRGAAPTGPARAAEARLEIAPPSSARGPGSDSGNQAMRSGIQAGGEGEMLRQQLQETRETLAARDAEVDELKARVAELEKLQQQQQQLIALKDNALASAQQTLATSNAGAPASATATVPQPQPREGNGSGIWWYGGLVLVVVALAGWLFSRRRTVRPEKPRRGGFDTADLAASMPAPAGTDARSTTAMHDGLVPPDGGDAAGEDVEVATAEAAMADAAPTWHGTTAMPPPAAAASGSAGEQLELAQAYLDVGDDAAARTLLRDVLNGRDPAARATAARLLRDL